MNKGNWGKVVAFFDVETKEGFTIKGFKLVEGENGIFVGYPSEKDSEGKYNNTVFADQDLKEQVLELAKSSYGGNSPISSTPPPMIEQDPFDSIDTNKFEKIEIPK